MNYNGSEVFFGQNELIVSKTDLKGRITYANHTFLDVAGYSENEVIGQPHNMIRHENMPSGVFELFWSTLAEGKEIFAYVVNSTKVGGYYWVIAHVTPSYENNQIVGYHSTRRVPNPQIIKSIIEPLYDDLNGIEQQTTNKKEGIRNSVSHLSGLLAEQGKSYDEYISSMMRGH